MQDFSVKSARGFYYDVSQSPYVYKSTYGDSFKLPSEKKLEMMQKQVPEELRRFDKVVERNDLKDFIPVEIDTLIRKAIIEAVHKRLTQRG